MISGTIKFSDLVVIEGEGNYRRIKEIMESEGPSTWMLKTDTTVITNIIASNFVLHLWYDGKAVIMSTDHPAIEDTPDDDFRRLSEWSMNNGWWLTVDDLLVSDRQSNDFWMRLYRAAIIKSDVLQKKEDDEISRMQAAYDRDQNEDEEEFNYGY